MRPDAIPCFAPHVRFRFDGVREKWLLLAPERVLIPDETAVAVLKLVDGKRSLETIVAEVATVHRASRGEIARDVASLFAGLANKGIMR
jgi:pyrroloquinoline quinone biosynthesis protein D